MDELEPAIRDLVTGGEDEEWQDFMPPSARLSEPAAAATSAGLGAHGQKGGTMDRELPIERVPGTEQAVGVELGGLYAVVTDMGDDSQVIVQVSGEVSATHQEVDTLAVVAAVYDSSGRVLGTLEHYYFEAFPGWDTFSLVEFVPGTPAKVRVFVRRTS